MNSRVVGDRERQQFQEEGYFLLEGVIPPEHLTILREACDRLIDLMHQEMDRLGTDHIHISHRGKRSHIAKKYAEAPRLGDYVFRAAEQGMTFSWHQDSGYLGFPHRPYVTCWAAVDDMTEANGTAYVLPFSEVGIRTLVEHVRDPQTGDKVGYFGRARGVPAIVPAGSLVVFSSLSFHRSGANTTDRMRRAYVTQYSPEPICRPGEREPMHLAVPFLQQGRRVAR